MNKALHDKMAIEVRAVIREAREAYNASYSFALKVLEIPEIKTGLEIYSYELYGDEIDDGSS